MGFYVESATPLTGEEQQLILKDLREADAMTWDVDFSETPMKVASSSSSGGFFDTMWRSGVEKEKMVNGRTVALSRYNSFYKVRFR